MTSVQKRATHHKLSFIVTPAANPGILAENAAVLRLILEQVCGFLFLNNDTYRPEYVFMYIGFGSCSRGHTHTHTHTHLK